MLARWSRVQRVVIDELGDAPLAEEPADAMRSATFPETQALLQMSRWTFVP